MPGMMVAAAMAGAELRLGAELLQSHANVNNVVGLIRALSRRRKEERVLTESTWSLYLFFLSLCRDGVLYEEEEKEKAMAAIAPASGRLGGMSVVNKFRHERDRNSADRDVDDDGNGVMVAEAMVKQQQQQQQQQQQPQEQQQQPAEEDDTDGPSLPPAPPLSSQQLQGQGQSAMVREASSSLAVDAPMDVDDVYRKWVKERYKECVKAMLGMVESDDVPPKSQAAAFHALMAFVRVQRREGFFDNELFAQIVEAMVDSDNFDTGAGGLGQLFVESYLKKYADVRFFTLKVLKRLISRKTMTMSPPKRRSSKSSITTLSKSEVVKGGKRSSSSGREGGGVTISGKSDSVRENSRKLSNSIDEVVEGEKMEAEEEKRGGEKEGEKKGKSRGESKQRPSIGTPTFLRNVYEILTRIPPLSTYSSSSSTAGGDLINMLKKKVDGVGRGRSKDGDGDDLRLRGWSDCNPLDREGEVQNVKKGSGKISPKGNRKPLGDDEDDDEDGDGDGDSEEDPITMKTTSKKKRSSRNDQKSSNKKRNRTTTHHTTKNRYWVLPKMQRKMVSECWLTFLRAPLPVDVYKKVLAAMESLVIPNLTNPLQLSDFLTDSYAMGGVVSIMALSGLFCLITKHGLEYPDFYNKLYAILEASIFEAKHRSRFFQLLDLCLKSSHLPAYLAAAFTKKLARLALGAPPAGAIVAIAMVRNLLRRHPSINTLVHREAHGHGVNDASRILIPPSSELDVVGVSASSRNAPGGEEEEEEEKGGGIEDGEGTEFRRKELEASAGGGADKSVDRRVVVGGGGRGGGGGGGVDPFLPDERDIAKCGALHSSLWEIDSLRQHYCPAVSKFVKSLDVDLTVRRKTMEVSVMEFSCGSYASIMVEQLGKKLKKVPLAFYSSSSCPTSLFGGNHPGLGLVQPTAAPGGVVGGGGQGGASPQENVDFYGWVFKTSGGSNGTSNYGGLTVQKEERKQRSQRPVEEMKGEEEDGEDDDDDDDDDEDEDDGEEGDDDDDVGEEVIEEDSDGDKDRNGEDDDDGDGENDEDGVDEEEDDGEENEDEEGEEEPEDEEEEEEEEEEGEEEEEEEDEEEDGEEEDEDEDDDDEEEKEPAPKKPKKA